MTKELLFLRKSRMYTSKDIMEKTIQQAKTGKVYLCIITYNVGITMDE